MAYAPVIPFENVTLTKVQGGGISEDFDQPASGAVTRWQGTVGAYLAEQLVEVIGGDEQSQVSHARLTFPLSLGIPIAQNDVVTFIHNAATVQRKVRDLVTWEAIGIVRATFYDI